MRCSCRGLQAESSVKRCCVARYLRNIFARVQSAAGSEPISQDERDSAFAISSNRSSPSGHSGGQVSSSQVEAVEIPLAHGQDCLAQSGVGSGATC